MKNGKLFALAVALILAAGVAIAGPGAKTNSTKPSTQTTDSKSATLHHQSGTVASMSANELVLDHTWKGKAEQTKFTLNPQTKREGDVKQGDHLTVYYHLDKGQRIATELKMETPSKNETKKS